MEKFKTKEELEQMLELLTQLKQLYPEIEGSQPFFYLWGRIILTKDENGAYAGINPPLEIK